LFDDVLVQTSSEGVAPVCLDLEGGQAAAVLVLGKQRSAGQVAFVSCNQHYAFLSQRAQEGAGQDNLLRVQNQRFKRV